MKRHYFLIFKLVTTLVFGCSYGATAATTKPAIGTTSTSKVTVTNDFLVTNHGVVNDSSLLQTAALQRVIDKAERAGGGNVIIPKGTFLSGALFFKPGTHLKLEAGAVLKGSNDITHYPLIPSRMEGLRLYYYAALINAYKVDNFSITGPGLINGNGERYWSYFWAYRDSMRKIGQTATNLEVARPRLVFLWDCDHVHIKEVKLWNAGFWTTHLYECNDALIEGCDIRSPNKPVAAPSTDGIDLDVCKRVIIRNCYIAVNDDAIVMKGGKGPLAHKDPANGSVENILIEGCTFGPSHANVTLGSECLHAKDIIVRKCTVNNNCPLLRLKMRPDTYQTYEGIWFENISGTCGTLIDMNPWRQFFDLNGYQGKPRADVRSIVFLNCNLNCNRFGTMQGNPLDSVSNILFKFVTVQAKDPTFKSSYTKIQFEQVTVNGSDFYGRP
jgi:polygalacturonase